MRPLSIVVPWYEKNESWEKTWEELKIQLNSDDEVIIIDDYSPSGVKDCGCDLIKVIKPPKLGSHIYRCNTLRNTGIQNAKHDAILILDPDCIPAPNLTEIARKIFDPAVLYGGRIDVQQEDGEIEEDVRLKRRNRRGMEVWGGCMLFSKSRTQLIDWFSEEFNGKWGLGEKDFANKCYHSGMELIYAKALHVTHQYHEPYREGHHENMQLELARRTRYSKNLDKHTSYRPRVAVSILTLMRPKLLKQCLRSVARTKIPIKIFLVNQGDESEEQMKVVNKWKDKWSVHYHFNNPPKWPGPARAEIFTMARDMGFQYVVTVDDDCYLYPNAIENLVKAADKHPEFHGISGFLYSASKRRGYQKYLLGGTEHTERGKLIYTNFFWVSGVHETHYICNGFRLVRLSPLITPDPEWTMGMTDFDWSMQVRKRGLRLAVCGDAGALHKYLVKGKKLEVAKNPPKYERNFRRNRAEINKMKVRFEEKWGVRL